MATRHVLLACIIGASVAVTAQPGSQMPMPPGGTLCPSSMTPSRLDYLLLELRSQSDIVEIQSAQLAQNISSDPSIRAFSQQLINDHGAAIAAKRQLALATGFSPTYSPSPAQQTLLTALAAVPPSQFDSVWLRTQVALHQQAIQFAEAGFRFGDDQRFVDSAAADLPVLQRHLDAAQAVMAGHTGGA